MRDFTVVASEEQIRLRLDILSECLRDFIKRRTPLSLILPSGQRLFNEISNSVGLIHNYNLPDFENQAVKSTISHINNLNLDNLILLVFDGIIVTGSSHRRYLRSLESTARFRYPVKLVSVASKPLITENFRCDDVLSAFRFDREHVSGFGFGDYRHLDYLISTTN